MSILHRWARAAAAAAVLALAAAGGGCAAGPAISPSAVRVVGDVQDVLAGRCTPDKFHLLDRLNVTAALGAGSPGNLADTGEMLMIYGRVFTRSTDAATGYATREIEDDIRTPFALAVPWEARGTGRPIAIDGETTLADLMTRRVRQGAVIALVKARRLETSAIKRAPIYGEAIQGPGMREKYFHPTRTLEDRWVLLMGVAVDPAEARGDAAAEAVLGRGYYVNLADKAQDAGAGRVQYHVHGWVLKARPAGRGLAEMARSAKVEEVAHLLGQSVFTQVEGEQFTLTGTR
ncbi:MAG: hypothetical protein BIFFINMI_04120 [Phycisphaerae bacterium]|nr:hypothetical protein [Phycisphaerae bacterium]